ncbi:MULTISPECIES: transporter substrate-binding domain-containing protein [Pseudoalteromonas]|uniref:transporter substrate-binding domain-containing protein n=1 Tax=Pseudoalteromonas TaxID=53246 RepID=UPI001FECC62B|nr:MULTISPECIES: transporter substrate-binding domain-containing protein [Pseudoalteromonas]
MMKLYNFGVLWLLLLPLAFTSFVHANEAIVNLHLASPSNTDTPRNHYIHALLTLAFAEQGKQVDFIYSIRPMNKKRVVEELSKASSINLAWLSLPANSYPDLHHTSLSIYQGLHGKRLLIINKNQQPRFAEISTSAQLKPLIALQKQSWSDYDVLIRNGFTVNGELDYKGMTRALETGLADYFPRSVSAIAAEVTKLQHQNLMIEPTIMLQYPSHYYFYTHKQNDALLMELEAGLLKLQKNGKFAQLYQQFFGEKERDLALSSRKVFHLN